MKKLSVVLAMLMAAVLLLSSCSNDGYSDKYAIKKVTLCTTNTNSDEFMKGFSMEGKIGKLISDPDVSSVAMCYTTANLAAVKKFFRSAPYNNTDTFSGRITALDTAGKIRLLSGDRRSYLDGNVDNPIRFYSDGVDLVKGGSLLQHAGTYHFYLVVLSSTKALWVGEAQKTFTIKKSTIETSNEFNKAFSSLKKTTLMKDKDLSSITQAQKTQAVKKYATGLVDGLHLGMKTVVTYPNDSKYPNDYKVVLSKNGTSSYTYVTVLFGKNAASK